MTFMVIGPNDLGVDGNMASHHRISCYPLLQPKILGRKSRIDRMGSSIELLSIATGVNGFTQVVIGEDRQRCGGITDKVIGLFEGLQPDEII